MRQAIHVEMDDGATYDIDADGRDIRVWESTYDQSWFAGGLSFTRVAQVAFLAGRRTGVLNGAYPDYDAFDAHCVEARGRPAPVVADPTPPVRTDDSSVRSRTGSAPSRRSSKARDRK
jgi:hypothetical protein